MRRQLRVLMSANLVLCSVKHWMTFQWSWKQLTPCGGWTYRCFQPTFQNFRKVSEGGVHPKFGSVLREVGVLGCPKSTPPGPQGRHQGGGEDKLDHVAPTG